MELMIEPSKDLSKEDLGSEGSDVEGDMGVMGSETTNLATINGFTVLGATRARLPEEVHIANLSGGDFEAFEEEDLEYFANLKLLDVSDNNLTSIEELSRLKLVELRVPVNSLKQLNIFKGAFEHLKVLDVSFNLLSSRAVVELGTLPNLTKLDVSGNNVGLLSASQFRSAGEGAPLYPQLQVLIAEQADLISKDLAALQHLPKLKELRVSRNLIDCIPSECQGPKCFACLEMLDLSHCKLVTLESVEQAEHFPKLRKILLHGNYLVPQQRLSKHPLSGKVELVEQHKSLKPVKQSISQMYNIELKKASLDYPNSRMDAFASISQEDIDEVFENLKDPMSIFQAEEYETVEQNEPENQEDDAQQEKEGGDSTFLTSVLEEHEESDADETPPQEEDPSNKLARAFGLDPEKVFSAEHLGLDATAAINALKFALEHPLIDYNATGKIEHHMKLTESASRRKLETRRFSPVKSAQKYKPSKRKEAIQDMLERMKNKLAIAKEKIAAVPA